VPYEDRDLTESRRREADGVLNDRDNIIVPGDESHSTLDGNLGRKMHEAHPNAFLFSLTGTPISPSCVTIENNGEIRPPAHRENAFARASGGLDSCLRSA
jgi:hypothetical protein